MLGAIIGDVAGSSYEVEEMKGMKENGVGRSYEERIKILDKSYPLFTDESCYTDDTVLTCAIFDAIENGNCNYSMYLKMYGLKELEKNKDKYGRNRFGKKFVEWLNGEFPGFSYGNGCIMRISPVGFLFDDYNTVKMESMKATIPTHNTIEALTASEAIATSIFLLNNGMNKRDVINSIKEDYYDLEYNLEDLQRHNKFSAKADDTARIALYIFSKSNSFEDAIRKAISVGGDTDTIAAVVGSLAEACWGVPEDLKEEVMKYLTSDMKELLSSYYKDISFKK